MPPTPAQTTIGYRKLWDHAAIQPARAAAAKAIAKKIVAKKDLYQEVERTTGVPWFMIGAIHNRESSLRFNAHLHCGDPLTARTTHVPKGRPVDGQPPFTWKDSAFDALTMPPHSLNKVGQWSVERMLYEMEKYNGWGYLKRGNSPYLWSWTSEYSSGKYVADHKYDPSAVDQQAGCAAIVKAVSEMDESVRSALNSRQAEAPKEVIDDYTAKERKIRTAAAAGGVGGGGAETANQTTSTEEAPPSLVTSVATYTVIGAAVAAFLAVTFLIVRKKALIAEKWG
jgi:lysozyme family protein